jgi:hypothetical protein
MKKFALTIGTLVALAAAAGASFTSVKVFGWGFIFIGDVVSKQLF